MRTPPAQFVLLSYLLPFALALKPCYYPNGGLAANDTACNRTTSGDSTCCGPTYACLSNNICVVTSLTTLTPGSSTYVRGSCTDSTWKSSDCPLFCINPQYDDVAGGEGIAKCPSTTSDEYYCIDGASSNCSEHYNVLSFPGTPTYVYDPAATSSTTSPQASQQSTSSSHSITSSEIAPQSTGLSSTTTALSSSFASSQSAQASVTPAPSSSRTETIGLAVGIPLGLLALAAVVYLVFRSRRKRKGSREGLASLMDNTEPGLSKDAERVSVSQTQLYELEENVPKAELSSVEPVHELYASARFYSDRI